MVAAADGNAARADPPGDLVAEARPRARRSRARRGMGRGVARLAVASAALALAAPFLGVRRPRLRDLPLIALCGLAGMTGYQLLLNTGERVVPAGTASLLVATAPVYASVLAVLFLGEHPGRRWWAGSAVADGARGSMAVR